MRSNHRVVLGVLAMGLGMVAMSGCKPSQAPATTSPPDHVHEKGKMLIADVGKYHALLTAHLSSKDGNELDIFIETATENPEQAKPVGLPLASFKAKVSRAGDDKLYEVEFTPAPMEERKDDKPGTCSHFVGKAPWMKKEDTLDVVATIPMGGKDELAHWKEFSPAKYAHHED